MNRFIHDDDCGETLDNGFCPRCQFSPDMQSTAIVVVPEPEPNGVPVYTVFFDPKDYPGQYVVRRFQSHAGRVFAELEPLAVVATLDDARGALPVGLVNLGRQLWDDSKIVEVWI